MRPPAGPATATLPAISYGPFGYIRTFLVGFLAGGFLFLGLTLLGGSGPAGYERLDPVRTLAACEVGCIALSLIVAAVLNYVIGKRIREDILLQRELFSGPDLPPPMPRPDVPGYDLGVARHRQSRQRRAA